MEASLATRATLGGGGGAVWLTGHINWRSHDPKAAILACNLITRWILSLSGLLYIGAADRTQALPQAHTASALLTEASLHWKGLFWFTDSEGSIHVLDITTVGVEE